MTLDRWLTLASVLVSALISWIVSRYFYRRADKRRTPTFVVKPTRKALSDAGLLKVQGLSVLLQGHWVGEQGVTEAEIYFWNSGTLPILRSEVLEQFSVTLPAVILQYEVLKSSREAVSIQVIGDDDTRPKTLTFQFAVLEPNDGATVRLIYDGPPDVKMEFSGSCLDAPKPTILPYSDLQFKSRTSRILQFLEPLILIPFMVVALGIFFLFVIGVGWLLKWTAIKLGWWSWVEPHAGQIWGTVVALVFGGMMAGVMWHQYKRISAKNVPPDIKP